MKLLKPSWVNHNDKPIFSIDIHPAGRRFATGGQGADSGRVVVWNLMPVLSEAHELDPNVPKMLCQMDNHLACVNSVRWSNNGRYLASGGDDRLVMIWAISVTGGPGSKLKSELWRCAFTLRGHAGDVLDLAWSPLDKWLASCSVDNTIIIWNASKFPEMVTVLNGHTGLVKGVAWDPVGKYLASQSDDKTLRVWNTADWTQETCVTEPFEDCGGTTHVLRLSWSPDGQYVLSAHAMNGGGPTARVLERKGWRCDMDFVGHRKAVTCVRFNNNLLMTNGKKCCAAAVGSRDRALSIWLTSLKRPLVVVHDLFSDSVLDISWSSDGLNLLACSSDGSVACIQFTNQEIGTPNTLDEKNAFYEKLYGKCMPHEVNDSLNDSAMLLECPEILLAREKLDSKKEQAKVENTHIQQPKTTPVRSIVTSSPVAVKPMDRQIETRTSDGKRRITPVFIPITQADPNESINSVAGGPEACFSTSSQSKSRICVERRDDVVIPNVSTLSNQSNQNLNTSKPEEPAVVLVRRALSPPLPLVCPSVPSPLLKCASVKNTLIRATTTHRVQVLNNACNTPYGALSRVQLLVNNSASTDPIWETYLGSNVCCMCMEPRWFAVSCEDATLHVWNISKGKVSRVLPPLVLPSRASTMTMSGDSLAVVTTSAELTIWDLVVGTCVVRPLSFRNLLSQGVSVTNCALLEDGNPLITLSNCKSYIYCKILCTWIVWMDSLDPLWRSSRGASAIRSPVTTSPLHSTFKVAQTNKDTINSRGPYTNAAARSWLETQVSSCLHLRLAKDYKHWIMALVTHLISHGSETQLRSILDEMLGPSHCTSTAKTWQSTVLGFKKHDLLEEMLSLIVRQLRWQRLYTEYNDQLQDIKGMDAAVVNGHC